MSNIDTNASTSQKNNLGAKTDGLVKQARELGRDLKGQASEFAQKATDEVKSQAGNLTGQAKEFASDAGEKLLATVSDQKAAGADYVGKLPISSAAPPTSSIPRCRRPATTSARRRPRLRAYPRRCATRTWRRSSAMFRISRASSSHRLGICLDGGLDARPDAPACSVNSRLSAPR